MLFDQQEGNQNLHFNTCQKRKIRVTMLLYGIIFLIVLSKVYKKYILFSIKAVRF